MNDPLLNAKTLHELDQGRLGRALNDAINQVLIDCYERPALSKKRTITIKITVDPVMLDGELELLNIAPSVSTSIPAQEMMTDRLTVQNATDEDGKSAPVAMLPTSFQIDMFGETE